MYRSSPIFYVKCLLVFLIFVVVLNFSNGMGSGVVVPKETPKISTQISVETAVTQEERINNYIKEICSNYRVSPELVESIVFEESRYKTDIRNGTCVGLMQINVRYHKGRAEKLGVSDFYDPYSNLLLGVDYLSELEKKYEDPALVLMAYNAGPEKALTLYKKGVVSNYALRVLKREKEKNRGWNNGRKNSKTTTSRHNPRGARESTNFSCSGSCGETTPGGDSVISSDNTLPQTWLDKRTNRKRYSLKTKRSYRG